MGDKLHSGPNQGKVVDRGDGKHIPIMIATPHLPALVLKPPTNSMTKYLHRICPKCKDYLGMESYEVQTDQLFWYQQEPWR